MSAINVRTPSISRSVSIAVSSTPRSMKRTHGSHSPVSRTSCSSRAFSAATQALPNPGAYTLAMTGPGVFSVETRDTIRHDVERLSTASVVLIVALLLTLYRSPRTLALGLLPVLTGVAAGIAAVSVAFGTVHGLTLGFGTTLIGEAVDYSIYLFVQSAPGAARGAERPADATRAWIAAYWPTIRLGVLTSVCGFASMLFSGFPGLVQLGLYSIAGLTSAALVTRFVLPHLGSPLPMQPPRDWT